MLPIEKKIESSKENQLVVTLQLPTNLPWFDGHFDAQPILPGVAQIEWAIHYGKQHFNIQMEFSSLEQVKFLSPILPLDEIQLQLNWELEFNRLQFKYFSSVNTGEAVILMSSGKIRLCP